MGRRFNRSAAITLGLVAFTCLAARYAWPTPWIYTQDRSRRTGRLTQIPEWRYPDGTYKPPQDINGHPPVAQSNLDFLWQSLQSPTLPSDHPTPRVALIVPKAVVIPLSALSLRSRHMRGKMGQIRYGTSARHVLRLLGRPATVWGEPLMNSGHDIQHWDYAVGEIDIEDGDYVVCVSSIGSGITDTNQ